MSFERMFLIYINRKYGVVCELKPPLGFLRVANTSLLKRVIYKIKYVVWKFDCFMYDSFCKDYKRGVCNSLFGNSMEGEQ